MNKYVKMNPNLKTNWRNSKIWKLPRDILQNYHTKDIKT